MTGKLTAISLFSGAGGLDVAAHKVGFVTRAAIEVNPIFSDTLVQNAWLSGASPDEFDRWFAARIPSMGQLTDRDVRLLRTRILPAVGRPNAVSESLTLTADIRDVSPIDVLNAAQLSRGQVNLVMGGPPCQTFSKAGQRTSLNDKRGQLFLEFARFVADIRPRWFLFENVKGLTHSKAEIVQLNCRTCGRRMPPYQRVLDAPAADAYPCPRCGTNAAVASRRTDKRGAVEVLLNEFESLGYTCASALLDAANFGAPQHRERFFIVGSRDNEKYSFPLPGFHDIDRDNHQLTLLDIDGLDGRPFRTLWQALFDNGPNPYHSWPIDPSRAVLWVKNVVRPHDERVTWTLKRPSPAIGAHQAAKLAIASNGVPEAQIWRQQWHTAGRRQGDRPPVYVEHSYLSDEDLLALQTFPRHWYVAGTRMDRAFQIGNAVPPLLGMAVLSSMAETSASRPSLSVATGCLPCQTQVRTRRKAGSNRSRPLLERARKLLHKRHATSGLCQEDRLHTSHRFAAQSSWPLIVPLWQTIFTVSARRFRPSLATR
jgi:DNA (cytosine-5)-methyltransferase 1